MSVAARVGSLLASALLALSWVASGLVTLFFVLLFTQPLTVPECASYERAGQHAARIGAVVLFASLIAVWLTAVVLVRSPRRSSALARLGLAVAVPLAVVATIAIGSSVTDWLIDRVDPSADHAMCW